MHSPVRRLPGTPGTLRFMLRIAPFPALRPLPEHAAAVAALPYDVVSREEAHALAAGNPSSFLHVSRAEIDLPPETDPYAEEVYTQARSALNGLVSRGIMMDDPLPGLFLYRQIRDGRAQTGLVCRCHIDDYANGLIKRHELTRRDKEDDRTRHVLAIRANAGPVFLAYRDDAEIDDLMAADCSGPPLYHFVAPDGVTHTVWRADDPMSYVEAFEQVDAAYVADGHHRAASAARAGAEMRSAHPDAPPDAPFNWFLSALFPASRLTILPYHRLVRDLNTLTPADLLKRLGSIGAVRSGGNPSAIPGGSFCVYVAGVWHGVEIDPAQIDRDDPVRSLDCDLVQRLVLEPILGIGDPRSDARIDFVGGIRGPAELVRRVDSGDAAIAIAMPATTMEQLLRVADAGAIMPPKSTWFEPKLRSGLLVHRIE